MGNVEAREAAETRGASELDPVPENDPRWIAIVNFMGAGSTDGKSFKVKTLWQVNPGRVLRQHEAKAKSLGEPTRLFHGTALPAAKAIVENGFKLPSHAGMYGKGVYFADDSRKSAKYAPESSWGPFFRRWGKQGLWSALTNQDEGQILVCDVYLGTSLRVNTAHNNLDPVTDLRPGWLRKLFGLGSYHSVYAPGWLSYSEYIVYEPHQAIPRYLVEFDYV